MTSLTASASIAEAMKSRLPKDTANRLPNKEIGENKIDLSKVFISILSPQQQNQQEVTLSEDLRRLSKLFDQLSKMANAGDLSDHHVEIIVKHIISTFLNRRVDKVFSNLFNEYESHWFIAASNKVKYTPEKDTK